MLRPDLKVLMFLLFNLGKTKPLESFCQKLSVMKPTIILTVLLLFAGSLFHLQAQDRIVKRNGEVIECKVLEVGSAEIKYSLAEYDFQVQFSIDKKLVDKIIFENGQELSIDHAAAAMEGAESNSADLFLVQNKNAFKLNFLSPLSGITTFSYERALKPGQSIEFSAGIIGLGFQNPNNALGVGLQAGYKFIRSPDFYLQGMRYAHILKGGYVRPELDFASYELRDKDRHVTKIAVLLNIGKQWVFSDVFLVDLYFGIGYGYSNAREFEDWPYFVAVGTDEVPIAAAWGLRIGFLL
jgi:hypothetical protein